MRLRPARGFAVLLLAWAGSGCTAAVVAVTQEQWSADRVFSRAIEVDLACIAAPWWLITEGPAVYTAEEALVVLYGSGIVAAYGIVDLPFTYAAYSFHRASRRPADRGSGG
ncbi:MAG: hypothetical protein ACT4PK_09885 [Gammaproteobacteria bacterium]